MLSARSPEKAIVQWGSCRKTGRSSGIWQSLTPVEAQVLLAPNVPGHPSLVCSVSIMSAPEGSKPEGTCCFANMAVPWSLEQALHGYLRATTLHSQEKQVYPDSHRHIHRVRQAFHIPDLEAQTSTDVIVRETICRYGLPRILHFDQGESFEAQVMKAMSETLGIQKSWAACCHPQGNSCVDRFNRTLWNMLSVTVKEDQSDWDLEILIVIAAYHVTPHLSTGYSPNFMIFGHESAMPTEVTYGLLQGTAMVAQHSYIEDLVASLWKAHQIAFEQGSGAPNAVLWCPHLTSPVRGQRSGLKVSSLKEAWYLPSYRASGRVPGRLSGESPTWSTKFVLEIKGVSCARIY